MKTQEIKKGSLCVITTDLAVRSTTTQPGDRVIVLEVKSLDVPHLYGDADCQVYNQRLQKKHWIYAFRLKILS